MGRSEYIIETEEPSSWLNTKERIVRCRNCKFAKWKANDCDGNEIFRCDRQIYFEVDSDGFCAWGEER